MKTEGLYKNGQKVKEQKGSTLTWFYKTGVVKARGKFVDNRMEGRWVFNRESGQLWQIGHFKNNKKHGEWVRYDKKGQVEYRARFADGKLVRE
jgi:antitoxin component YwqK of YwqJK toxin-antitoxin module